MAHGGSPYVDDKPYVPQVRTMTPPKKEKVGSNDYWTCRVNGIDGKAWVVPVGPTFTAYHEDVVSDYP